MIVSLSERYDGDAKDFDTDDCDYSDRFLGYTKLLSTLKALDDCQRFVRDLPYTAIPMKKTVCYFVVPTPRRVGRAV